MKTPADTPAIAPMNSESRRVLDVILLYRNCSISWLGMAHEVSKESLDGLIRDGLVRRIEKTKQERVELTEAGVEAVKSAKKGVRHG